jgi:hypothetical protein
LLLQAEGLYVEFPTKRSLLYRTGQKWPSQREVEGKRKGLPPKSAWSQNIQLRLEFTVLCAGAGAGVDPEWFYPRNLHRKLKWSIPEEG